MGKRRLDDSASKLRERLRPPRIAPGSRLRRRSVSSPGANTLLIETERAVERGLHAVRGIFWLFLGLWFFFGLGMARRIPAVLTLVGLLFGLFVWLWSWRAIARDHTRRWLRYVLIVADGWVTIRPIAYGSLQNGTIVLFGLASLRPADLVSLIGPFLVYVALSGALRIEPRVAAFSSLIAVGAWIYTAVALQLPSEPAIGTGAVIGLVGVVGALLARVLRGFALRASQERVLERFVPSSLTEELAASGDPERVAHQRDVTLLMADLRGFTRMSEHMSPAEAVDLLNEYYGAVVAPLESEGAVVNDYVGDGMLAFFEGEDRSLRALRAARGMLSSIEQLNASRPTGVTLRMGIALHAGTVLIGTIGTPSRRQYTIVGDAVNVTERLEKYNKELGAVIVISVAALGEVDALALGFCGPRLVELRGRDEPLAVHFLPRVEVEAS